MSASSLHYPFSASLCFQQALAMYDEDVENEDICNNCWPDEDSDASDCIRCSRPGSISDNTKTPDRSGTGPPKTPPRPPSRLLRRRSSEPIVQTQNKASNPTQHSRGRRMSCTPKPEAHVQWADEKNEVLVREHPRRRFERKPFVKPSEPLRPILKQS